MTCRLVGTRVICCGDPEARWIQSMADDQGSRQSAWEAEEDMNHYVESIEPEQAESEQVETWAVELVQRTGAAGLNGEEAP